MAAAFMRLMVIMNEEVLNEELQTNEAAEVPAFDGDSNPNP